jgi:hypothetical protein
MHAGIQVLYETVLYYTVQYYTVLDLYCTVEEINNADCMHACCCDIIRSTCRIQ